MLQRLLLPARAVALQRGSNGWGANGTPTRTAVHRINNPVALGQHARRHASAAAAVDSHHVSLVQGASRGIGLEMVRQLLERDAGGLFAGRPAAAGGHVVATCRNPSEATALSDLLRMHPDRLSVLRLDVTDPASIDAAAIAVTDMYGRVDVIANTAAVLHVPGEMAPETSIGRLTEEAMLRSFRVNAMGPVLVVKAFAPLLMQATERSAASDGGGGAGPAAGAHTHSPFSAQPELFCS